MSFDPPTMLALTAVVAITAGALIIISRTPGRSSLCLVLWGASDIVGGLGAALLIVRGFIADFATVAIAGALLTLAYGLSLAATRAFVGKQTPIAWIGAGAALWLGAGAVPSFFASQPSRIALLSAVLAAYSFLCAGALWSGRAERLASRAPAIAFLLIHGAACACRVPVALLGGLDSARLVGGPWFTVLLMEALVNVIAMAILIVSMAKERAELEQRLAASVDELTGVATRRAFLAEGESRLGAVAKNLGPASVLLLDLDHFKSVNDSFGHEAGDRVLQAFAACVRRVLRPSDLFGRIGGEEFAALLVGASAETAFAVAERVRRAVEAIDLGERLTPAKLSVSVGVATAAREGQRLAEMLSQADRALYRAKSAGRNRVEKSIAPTELAA